MTGRRNDWLDRLALRSLAQPIEAARAHEVALGDEKEFSRGTAVKLALAGAAALTLRLGAAPAASAQDKRDCFADASADDRGDCFTYCLECHDIILDRRVRSCKDVFEPRAFKRSAPGSWKRYQFLIFGGGVRDYATAGAVLEDLCELKAQHELARDKKNCYDRCETTCRQRSVQSRSARYAPSCEVTPPSKAPPPTIPPIPSHAPIAACAGCSESGGWCCGSCPKNPLAAACVGVWEGKPDPDCATALATQC